MADKKFEQYMQRLDEIVKTMESGSGNLDETLALYEEGVHISKVCNKMLDEAQQKVTVLSKADGKITEKDFDGDTE